MGGFTGNPSGTRLVLVVLAILFAWMAAGAPGCSEAAAQQPDPLPAETAQKQDDPPRRDRLSVAYGAMTIGSSLCDFQSMTLAQEFGGRTWLGTLVTHGEGECRDELVQANIGACVIRTATAGRWTLGFGPCLWEHGDIAVGNSVHDDGVRLTAAILVQFSLMANDRLFLNLPLHASSGGSTGFNRGRNLIQLGGRF